MKYIYPEGRSSSRLLEIKANSRSIGNRENAVNGNFITQYITDNVYCSLEFSISLNHFLQHLLF